MPISFNPGQAAAPAQTSSGIPQLVVPSVPSIATNGNASNEEKLSPFAYKNRSKSKFPVYFQGAIFLVFGIVLAITIALFMYKGTLSLEISSRQSDLTKLESGFKKMPIDDMQRLSSRLALINKILNERVSVNTAFTILEESVGDSVTYTKFDISKSSTGPSYLLSFGGDTTSYDSLYQQIQILKSKTFAGVFPKISIFGYSPLDKKGITSFKVESTVAIGGVNPDSFSIIHKDGEGSTTPQVPVTQAVPQDGASSTPSLGQ